MLLILKIIVFPFCSTVTTLQEHHDEHGDHQPETIEVQEEDFEDGGMTLTLAVSDAESEQEDKQYMGL